ncbi:GIN domain-containing protein [Flavobacterium cerinum]|nr:DUF2807 domain-containing protein [Flavobacterium cerinum]
MKTFLAITALVSFQLAAGQKTIELKDFNSLSVGSDTKITMVKSSQNKLVINSSDDDDLSIVNEGGFLKLNGGEDLEITLYYKDGLESISADADAEVWGKDEIKAKELSITASADAKIELVLNVKKLNTTISSDAMVTLTGKAENHNAVVSSDADFKGEDLLTENTNILLSSDGTAAISVKGIVDANVSNDALLKVYGNPKKVNEITSTDGHIKIVR